MSDKLQLGEWMADHREMGLVGGSSSGNSINTKDREQNRVYVVCLQAVEEKTDPCLTFHGPDFPVAFYPLKARKTAMEAISKVCQCLPCWSERR